MLTTYHKRTWITAYMGHGWLNFGWYPGEEFKLFAFMLGEVVREYPDERVGMIVVFNLQITHFCFSFGWRKR